MPVPNASGIPCPRRTKGNRITEVHLKNKGLASALEREREVNSRLKDEIILLKQKDLKHCGDLSTYKCIITSLASKLTQIQMLASEASTLAEQAFDESCPTAMHKHNPVSHCVEGIQGRTTSHQEHQNGGVNLNSTEGTHTKTHTGEHVQSRLPHSTPTKRSLHPKRPKNQTKRCTSMFPVRRLSDPRITKSTSRIPPNSSSQHSPGGSSWAESTFDLHSPLAPYEADPATTAPHSGPSQTRDMGLVNQQSPNMPTVNEDVAAFTEIDKQIKKLSIGSSSHNSPDCSRFDGETQSMAQGVSTQDNEENSNTLGSDELNGCTVTVDRGNSQPQPLGDITNIRRKELTTFPSIVHSNHSTQATSSGVLGGVNGVSVFPGLRQSRLSNLTRKSPLKHPNITLLSCDISERDKQMSEGNSTLRKSSRQCISKAISYREEALNSKKRREDSFGIDPFFLETWKSKLARNGTKVKKTKRLQSSSSCIADQ